MKGQQLGSNEESRNNEKKNEEALGLLTGLGGYLFIYYFFSAGRGKSLGFFKNSNSQPTSPLTGIPFFDPYLQKNH
jgi:hypothetical protein